MPVQQQSLCCSQATAVQVLQTSLHCKLPSFSQATAVQVLQASLHYKLPSFSKQPVEKHSSFSCELTGASGIADALHASLLAGLEDISTHQAMQVASSPAAPLTSGDSQEGASAGMAAAIGHGVTASKGTRVPEG